MYNSRSPILFFSLILITSLLSIRISAQSSEFKSIEELHATFVQNENRIGNLSSHIGKLKDHYILKDNEISNFYSVYREASKLTSDARNVWTEKLLKDVPSNVVFVSKEIKALRNDYIRKEHQFKTVKKQLKKLYNQRDGLESSENNTNLKIIQSIRRRYEIIGQAEFFNPPCLSEIFIIRNNPSTKKQDTLYKKTLNAPKKLKLLKLNIENQLSAIREFEEMIAGPAQKRVEATRNEFMNAHNAWEQKNIEYEDMIYEEAAVRVLLETVDVAIALAEKGGPSPPAVAFELFWRGGTFINWYATGEGFEYEIPKVSQSYIDHIKRFGLDVDNGALTSSPLGRRKNIIDDTDYDDSFTRNLAKDLISESMKSGSGLVASTLIEVSVQRKLAKSKGWWSIVMKGRWEKSYELYQIQGGEAFNDVHSLLKHLKSGENTFSDLVSNMLKNSEFKKKALTDIAKSIGYTIVKDGLNHVEKNRRFKVYRDLSILEIDWFIKRNAYNKAMWFREGQKKILASLLEELGTLYYKKYSEAYNNEINVLHNYQIATSQAAKAGMIDLILKFSKPLKQNLKLNLEGQSKQISPKPLPDNLKYKIAITKLLDDSDNFEGGSLKLTVTGKSLQGLSLDGMPQTLAFYNAGSNAWVGFESRGAGDQTNTINFIKPTLSLDVDAILPKPEKVPIEVSFLSVDSFVDHAFIAIYPVSESNVNGPDAYFSPEILHGEISGTKTLMASLEVGDYEVRLDDGFGDFAAKVDVSVKAPKGLLNMKAFDKEDTETDYYVRIFKAEDTTILKAASGVDLTEELEAGNYKLYFSVDMEDVERTVEIKAGETSYLEIHLKEDEKEKSKEPEKPEKEVEFLLPAPPRWSTGVLYNSNDGDCQYGGEYLIFMSAGQRGRGRFLNRHTAEFSQFVAVAPGKKLEVAVPANGIFIRVFHIKVLPEDLSTVPWNSISHGTLSNLVDGWWYQAGCKSGTKPKSRCDNGAGSGPSTPISCATFGED